MVAASVSQAPRAATSEARDRGLPARPAPAAEPFARARLPVAGASPLAELGQSLRELCAARASGCFTPRGVTLSCTAAEAWLPWTTVIVLRLVADELITSAFLHAFPTGRRGRIAVTFLGDAAGWRLAVEDSGPATPPDFGSCDYGRARARVLAGWIGGELTTENVVGGHRCVVTAPRRTIPSAAG